MIKGKPGAIAQALVYRCNLFTHAVASDMPVCMMPLPDPDVDAMPLKVQNWEPDRAFLSKATKPHIFHYRDERGN